ncbi:MAG: PLDc N-terminal domain-containing protein [Gordonia paraffinivorans]
MPYLGLITVLVMIVALVDIVGSDESSIRGLPRSGWILLVVAVPLVGSVVWVVAGRPRAAFSGRIGDDEPGVKPTVPDAESEAEFRRQVRERAEEQRRRAETDRRDQES